MRSHRITFAALAVAAGLSLTACQNDDDAAQTDPSPVATSSPSRSSADSGGSDAGAGGEDADAGAGSDASGQAAKCRTDGLKITAIDNFIDGDPRGTVAVEMENTGGRDCVVAGFAGVDLKTDSGSISADRKGAPGDPYVLKNGKKIAFSVTYPLNETGGSGVRITGLVVTPPNETKSVTLAWPGKPSLPVTDGSGEPVRVGPIGSAGQGG
ncbi:DUF4232 domain-containing protein [Streptomyces drozdowiczii]|uniref:DUF4232 domain-containing protein n=1 Tax=Streptomyces drozdowiczii TaxID=202862 RepID=A0ABY6PT53_9ACTN|nr:DUF4232 domain-containing protein [Streptomyces drozdowiczii]MCX0244809.1 DUF4232 domain-containing protein [Streptomyces drozdowiczii]UZK55464.1 DUF4232 domain-containing protein [Streptomyces drozdowiczii]